MNKWQCWLEHWERMFDGDVQLHPLPRVGLPSALARRFSCAVLQWGGMRFLAVLDEERDTPSNYRRHRESLVQLLGLPVVFFLPQMESYLYGRLVRARISFVSRGGRAYLPELLANLAPLPQLSAPAPAQHGMLSPVAQVLLLRQLLFHDLHAHSLRHITGVLGAYSAMAVSKAKDELAARGLCHYAGALTRGQLEFPDDDLSLCEMAQPFLRSPVMKRHFVRASVSLEGLPLAGESALSELSLLEPPARPTYAVGKADVKAVLAHALIREVEEEDAEAVIEHWRYDPQLLMKRGARCVDKLSLYLSLCDSEDERIAQELNKLSLP